MVSLGSLESWQIEEEMKTYLFTHSYLYNFISSVEHTKRYFKELWFQTTLEPTDFYRFDHKTRAFLKISPSVPHKRENNTFGMTSKRKNFIFGTTIPLFVSLFRIFHHLMKN